MCCLPFGTCLFIMAFRIVFWTSGHIPLSLAGTHGSSMHRLAGDAYKTFLIHTCECFFKLGCAELNGCAGLLVFSCSVYFRSWPSPPPLAALPSSASGVSYVVCVLFVASGLPQGCLFSGVLGPVWINLDLAVLTSFTLPGHVVWSP